MTVLIVTHSEDNASIGRVQEALAADGVRSFRFDTDRFPTEVLLRAGYGPDAGEVVLEDGGHSIDLRQVSAVWYRRLRAGQGIPDDLDPRIRDASVGETKATALGALAAVEAFCLDPWTRIRQAEMKPLQLRIAHELGLAVPRTLITNDPAGARAFFDACRGRIVTKMMTAFAIYEGDEENVVFTNEVSPADLDDLDGLSLCPMTFQEKIDKALELRVTIVGDQVFAASIDSQQEDGSRLDWRRRGADLVDQWQEHDLPDAVSKQLLALMDRLHINYGAIDLILTPDRRYVFLEVNPAGEFFWLETQPGLRISEALARVLAGKALRRENRGVV